ncbi:transposase family protein [Streptomyces sp. NPDC007904]|uniref:transposase family protein n=1 Tax=Streptomyces sp. NPDC007904 TaxID=3364787 RepID=UPI0036E5ABED
MSPHLDAVRVERVWVASGVVRVAARTRELTVACPDCGRGSARVHSRYDRMLSDVSVGGRPVLIGLSVRRALYVSGWLSHRYAEHDQETSLRCPCSRSAPCCSPLRTGRPRPCPRACC